MRPDGHLGGLIIQSGNSYFSPHPSGDYRILNVPLGDDRILNVPSGDTNFSFVPSGTIIFYLYRIKLNKEKKYKRKEKIFSFFVK